MLIATASAQTVATSSGPQQDTAERTPQALPSSLAIVPDDVAFYCASMNHRAQYEAVANSQLVGAFLESPVPTKLRTAYRTGKRRGWEQFGDDPLAAMLAQYDEVIDSPPGRFALSIAKEVVAHELFVYAEEDWNTLFAAGGRAYQGVMRDVLDSGVENMSEEEAQRLLMEHLTRELADVNIPTIVVGAVMEKPELMRGFLQIAKTGIEESFGRLPPEWQRLRDGYKVTETEDTFLLSLTVTDDDLPWDTLIDEDMPEGLRELCRGKSLAVTLGVKGNYLLFSIGPSTEHIDQLGQGPLLVDSPRLKPLKDAMNRQLTGVVYLSQTTIANTQDSEYFVEQIRSLATALLDMPEIQDWTTLDELRAAIQADAAELATDLRAMTPAAGPYLDFSYLTSSGLEGFRYDWREHKPVTSGQPLEVLHHTGSQPALVLAGRDEQGAEEYAMAAKWGRKLWDYAKKTMPQALETSGEADADEVNQVLDGFEPFLERLDAATRDKLIPATSNGEYAVVVDFEDQRPSWFRDMPSVDQPVPIPAAAIVIEVKDEKLLREAGSEYLAIARDIVEWVRTQPGNEIPDEFRIVDPARREVDGREVFYWPLVDEWGVDSSIAPYAAIDDGWAVLGYSMDQAPRLLASNNPEFVIPPVPADQPIVSAALYDNHALVDALDQWRAYVIKMAQADGQMLGHPGDPEAQTKLILTEEEIKESVDRLVDLLKGFRGYASVTFAEDTARVTYYQLRFQDKPR